jgi:hypothetical protein
VLDGAPDFIELSLPPRLQQLHNSTLRRNQGIDPRRLAVEVVGDDALGGFGRVEDIDLAEVLGI